ncbi:hypothetical protein CK203_016342 [Vitis vinifera]|uniref:Uncharacterized protein n=1 Tax=Vitis vinifera TaxID=29760 RepID=A0A438J172_VITVI|nr:hypothetical protein CK203_016342 [Vitis vinifera]
MLFRLLVSDSSLDRHATVALNSEFLIGNSYGEANDSQEIAFDLGVFVGDLNFEEDVSSDDISLEGLQKN